MEIQSPQPENHPGKRWPGQTLVAFRPEIPEPTEWDQLLTRLALSDSQALEAVRSDGDLGQQLRTFVLRSFRYQFVPEAAIDAVRRRRKEERRAKLLAGRPTATNAVATASGEQV